MSTPSNPMITGNVKKIQLNSAVPAKFISAKNSDTKHMSWNPRDLIATEGKVMDNLKGDTPQTATARIGAAISPSEEAVGVLAGFRQVAGDAPHRLTLDGVLLLKPFGNVQIGCFGTWVRNAFTNSIVFVYARVCAPPAVVMPSDYVVFGGIRASEQWEFLKDTKSSRCLDTIVVDHDGNWESAGAVLNMNEPQYPEEAGILEARTH